MFVAVVCCSCLLCADVCRLLCMMYCRVFADWCILFGVCCLLALLVLILGRCLLFVVVRCLLFVVVCCSLLAVCGCLLFVAYWCLAFDVDRSCVSRVGAVLWCVVCCVLHCLLLAGWCSLFVVRCSLSVAGC